MGTRSLTHVHSGDIVSPVLVTIYRQFDGYPDGIGKDIAEFLGDMKIVNGISDRTFKQANGMECLAAQLIGHLKNAEVGNVYIYPASSKDCGEEFTYHVYERDGEAWIQCVEACMDTPARSFTSALV